ncbi:hypothetical protein ACEUZ9_002836 [Paracoccus litorisediminis]|uniref:hypothetical protein n=1 Tax=Paracoccus litorisediminis TaxID=2006130 RepID=UPI003731FCF0
MKSTAFAGALTAVILTSSGYAADIQTFKSPVPDASDHVILLTGEIEPGDAEKLDIAINSVLEKRSYISTAYLYSPGGDLNAGMEMGRTLRKYRIGTSGPFSSVDPDIPSCLSKESFQGHIGSKHPRDQCQCASSCAIAWMGGVERSGIVDIHRAYLTPGQGFESFSAQDRSLGTAYQAVADYLAEMRAPDSIRQIFLATPSSRLTRIEGREVGKDPAWEEYLLSQCGNLEPPAAFTEERNRLFRKQIGGPLTAQEQSMWEALSKPVNEHRWCLEDAMQLARLEAQQKDLLCGSSSIPSTFTDRVDAICGR